MSRIYYFLIGAMFLFVACKKESKKDKDEYPDCRYELWYKLDYSPVDSTMPVSLVYLSDSGKRKSLLLKDTMLELKVSYKYGDSVYVRFDNSDIYFLNRQSNKIKCSYKIKNVDGSGECPVISRSEDLQFDVGASSTITSAILEVPPRVLR